MHSLQTDLKEVINLYELHFLKVFQRMTMSVRNSPIKL